MNSVFHSQGALYRCLDMWVCDPALFTSEGVPIWAPFELQVEC